MSSETASKVSENKALAILTLVLILDLISFASILPLFPSIFERYSKQKDDVVMNFLESTVSTIQNTLNIPNEGKYNSVLYGGLLGSLFSFLQFMSFPIFGGLSDVFGRKPMLLVSIVGSLLSYVIWYYSETFTIFLISRIIGGLSKASTSISIAIAADICNQTNKVKGMALVGISFSVGFIVGPLIGAIFSSSSNDPRKDAVVALFAIIVTIIEGIIVVGALPETLTIRTQKIQNIASKALLYINPKSLFNFEAISGTIEPTKHERIKLLSKVYFMYLFLYSGLEFTLSFLTHQRFNYTASDQGKMYLFIGIIMVILQGGVLRRIPNHKQMRTIYFTMTLIMPAYFILAISLSTLFFGMGLFLYSFASAFVVPCLTSLVAELCTDGDKGTTMGVFRSLGALARAFGPVFSSIVFWALGPTTCYSIGGILFIIPLVILRSYSSSTYQCVTKKNQPENSTIKLETPDNKDTTD